LTSKRLRSGQSVTLTYDALNRLTQETFPSGTSLPVYYGYDLLNRVLMVSNSSPTGPGVAYVYDALGRPTSMTQNSKTLTYAYDAAGNRTGVTWPDTSNPLTATYVYDPLNHVTQIEQNGATSGAGLLAAYSYDGAGRRTAVSRAGGAGLATSYSYDAISRLSTLTQTLASSAGTTFTLGYNPANQVVSRADSNGAFTVRPSAISLTYTANGLNQYSAISGGTQTLAAGPQAALTYDPLGRIQSVTTSGSTSNFLYDGAFLAEEYNASGTTTARYVPGPGTDEPLTVYSGASLSYPNWYAADQEGSTIATANSSATEVASFAYGPYGEPLTSAGAPAWAGARYRYTGQIVIAGAQTYFYKARMYDPSTGRFVQTDPAGFGGGINIYAYATDDPINGSDPSGNSKYPTIPTGSLVPCPTDPTCGLDINSYAGALGLFSGGGGGPVSSAITQSSDATTVSEIMIFGEPYLDVFPGLDSPSVTINSGNGSYQVAGIVVAAVPQKPQNGTCPSGQGITAGLSPSITGFVGVIGISIGVGVNISIPTNTKGSISLKGSQIAVSASITPLTGLGIFFAGGPSISMATYNSPTKLFSGSSTPVIQGGASDGGGGEIARALNNDPADYSGSGGRIGAGGYGAVGQRFSGAITTPRLGC